jgi:hypothetical protein
MRLPSTLITPAIIAAFACGLLSSRFPVREAHAQSSYLASTVYVPSDGLAFRAFDGRVVAKLSYDTHGGVFEIYDEHEHLAASVRGGGVTPAMHAEPQQAALHDDATKPLRPDLGF